MAEKRFAEEPAAMLEPRIDKLLTMMGAARDAFNRHSRTSLQELQSLAGGLAQDFAAISTHLKSLTARKPEGEHSHLIRLPQGTRGSWGTVVPREQFIKQLLIQPVNSTMDLVTV